MKERNTQKPPQIISELNANLVGSELTVEKLAENIGINKATLYRWVRKDAEFLEALKIIREVQADDPFKTDTIEDSRVNAVIIYWLDGHKSSALPLDQDLAKKSDRLQFACSNLKIRKSNLAPVVINADYYRVLRVNKVQYCQAVQSPVR